MNEKLAEIEKAIAILHTEKRKLQDENMKANEAVIKALEWTKGVKFFFSTGIDPYCSTEYQLRFSSRNIDCLKDVSNFITLRGDSNYHYQNVILKQVDWLDMYMSLCFSSSNADLFCEFIESLSLDIEMDDLSKRNRKVLNCVAKSL